MNEFFYEIFGASFELRRIFLLGLTSAAYVWSEIWLRSHYCNCSFQVWSALLRQISLRTLLDHFSLIARNKLFRNGRAWDEAFITSVSDVLQNNQAIKKSKIHPSRVYLENLSYQLEARWGPFLPKFPHHVRCNFSLNTVGDSVDKTWPSATNESLKFVRIVRLFGPFDRTVHPMEVVTLVWSNEVVVWLGSFSGSLRGAEHSPPPITYLELSSSFLVPTQLRRWYCSLEVQSDKTWDQTFDTLKFWWNLQKVLILCAQYSNFPG